MNTNQWVRLENSKSESGNRIDDLHVSDLVASHSNMEDPILTAIFSCLGVDESYLSGSTMQVNLTPCSTVPTSTVSANTLPAKDVPTLASSDIAIRPWILHVDDDIELSNAIKMRLDLYGVSVGQARNGLGGVRQAFTTPAAAILLDYEMPQGDGRYVLQKLKSCDHTRNIPVIILTGHQDRKLKHELLALGAACFLSKPIKLELLLNTLRPYVEMTPPRGVACLLT